LWRRRKKKKKKKYHTTRTHKSTGETGGKDFHFCHESADIDNFVTCTVRGSFEYQGFYLYIYWFIYLFIYLYLFIINPIYLFICLFIYLIFIYLFIHLFTFIYFLQDKNAVLVPELTYPILCGLKLKEKWRKFWVKWKWDKRMVTNEDK
jgi:hypothetical protein